MTIDSLSQMKSLMEEKKKIQESYNNENISTGIFTYGIPKVYFQDQGSKLYIGKFCSLSTEISIFLGGEHRSNWITTYPFHAFIDLYKDTDCYPSKGDVVIGNDVWIGYGATILSGVSIGSGAVIGAKSVIRKNVPPYAVVAGNPAKILRFRFNIKTIRKLLRISWWDWDLEDIDNVIPYLISEDINMLLRYYYNNIYYSKD